MYGSNSWGGHHRQSHMQNPYGGSSYPNVHYAQSQHYQQKSHYGGGGGGGGGGGKRKSNRDWDFSPSDHSRNDRKNESRKYQDRMKAMSRDYVSSSHSNQGKSQTEKNASNKETDEKNVSVESTKKLEDEPLDKIAKKPDSENVATKESSENKIGGQESQAENADVQSSLSQLSPSINIDKVEVPKETQPAGNKSNPSDKSAVKSIIDGGNLFPFYCEICDAKCNSESNYNDHLKGSRHLRNVRQQEQSSSDAKRIRLDETVTNREVENNDQPFSQNRGRFESTGENKENKAFQADRFNDANANKGFPRKNESRWIDGNEYPLNSTYEDAESNSQKTEKDKADFEKCTIPGLGDYEDNAQSMDFNNEKSSDEFNQEQESTENAEKTEEQNEPDTFEKFLSSDSSNMSLSKGNLGTLLDVLTKCAIKNEEDADMALKVSNMLTKSLLKYRLENMPPDVLSAALQTGKNLWFGENMKNTVSTFKPGHPEISFPGPDMSGPLHPPKQNTPLLPTPGSNPVPQHFRPLNSYNQQKYDRY